MRWALRNQKKIAEKLGDNTLVRIIVSLNRYFTTHKEIESKLCDGDKYETILIDDSKHTSNMIAFYVIRKTYNSFNLAFKEFIG